MRGMAREYAAGNSFGPGWRESAGIFGCPVGGSVADGAVRPGVDMARSRAKARLNFSAQGQRSGRCRVNRRAERVSRPAREKNLRRKVLVVAIRSPRPICRRPSGQVVGHRLDGRPGAVGGEAARGEMVQPDAVLEVGVWHLDLGVAAMVSLRLEQLPVPVGDEAMIAVFGEEGQLGTGRRLHPPDDEPYRRGVRLGLEGGAGGLSTSAAPSIQ